MAARSRRGSTVASSMATQSLVRQRRESTEPEHARPRKRAKRDALESLESLTQSLTQSLESLESLTQSDLKKELATAMGVPEGVLSATKVLLTADGAPVGDQETVESAELFGKKMDCSLK